MERNWTTMHRTNDNIDKYIDFLIYPRKSNLIYRETIEAIYIIPRSIDIIVPAKYTASSWFRNIIG